jgi:hypothetical protein
VFRDPDLYDRFDPRIGGVRLWSRGAPGTLLARKTFDDPPIYRVWFDDGSGELEIGSIAERRRHTGHKDVFWTWGVDIMPLMDHGASGEVETFDLAIECFRDAFTSWLADVPAELWAKNRDYKRSSAERWRVSV